jgi:hypothetical protein
MQLRGGTSNRRGSRPRLGQARHRAARIASAFTSRGFRPGHLHVGEAPQSAESSRIHRTAPQPIDSRELPPTEAVHQALVHDLEQGLFEDHWATRTPCCGLAHSWFGAARPRASCLPSSSVGLWRAPMERALHPRVRPSYQQSVANFNSVVQEGARHWRALSFARD